MLFFGKINILLERTRTIANDPDCLSFKYHCIYFLLVQKSLEGLQKCGLTALEQIADPPCLGLCQTLIPGVPE